MGPIVSIRCPSTEAVKAFLVSQAQMDFTYAAIGATAQVPPSGYNVDHSRVKLGEGERAFLAAKAALESWTHFHLGWAEAKSFESSLRVGGVVAIVGRSLGLWWLNACRIVYLVGDEGPVVRFGFGYGTLPGHAETGEERFLVEWDRRDDGVWYDIVAFSRPHGLLAHLGYPWLRQVQHRFAVDSGRAMCRAVSKSDSSPLMPRVGA